MSHQIVKRILQVMAYILLVEFNSGDVIAAFVFATELPVFLVVVLGSPYSVQVCRRHCPAFRVLLIASLHAFLCFVLRRTRARSGMELSTTMALADVAWPDSWQDFWSVTLTQVEKKRKSPSPSFCVAALDEDSRWAARPGLSGSRPCRWWYCPDQRTWPRDFDVCGCRVCVAVARPHGSAGPRRMDSCRPCCEAGVGFFQGCCVEDMGCCEVSASGRHLLLLEVLLLLLRQVVFS